VGRRAREHLHACRRRAARRPAGESAVLSAFAHTDHELDPDRVADLLARGEIELIDVREPYEREAGFIENSRHIELERLASNAESIPRDRQVVFHCRLGARSGMATQAFRAAGWDAWNMTGGITEWVERGLPIAPDDGYVAEH
jgi:rhodanese-related sulfurtransferase